jgi:hypothetical protein
MTRLGPFALLAIGIGTCVDAEDPLPSRWAYEVPVRPALPKTGTLPIHSHPVDAFIQVKLEARGLTISPPADRSTLIRRLHLNLLGLPPSPEEVAEFVEDQRPDAYERLVDRILASPHLGENLARMWLDTARFTESQGFERDKPRDHAWPYRDYVIQSFNRNKPYDRFVIEQIAGDVLPGAGTEGIIATGFLTCGPYDEVGHTSARPSVRARAREDELEDLVSTVTQTFLGLTVNCARCHDHKYDPIPQADYYRIRSVFDAIRPGDRALLTEAEKESRRQRRREIEPEVARLLKECRALEVDVHESLSRLGGEPSLPIDPRPIARWSFEHDLGDGMGTLRGKSHGKARVENGKLILDGAGAFVETEPLTVDLREKTLEAWVVLSDRKQRGGAVMSIVSGDGQVFDAIVFGEMQQGRWMAGSDFWRRSREHHGKVEQAPVTDLIHIAVTYGANGEITVFRNGQPYFAPYRPTDDRFRQITFRRGEARILFGLRHPGASNGFLQAAIEEARLYDRALTPAEIANSYTRGPAGLSPADWSRAAKPGLHQLWSGLQAKLAKLRDDYEATYRESFVYATLIQPAKPARVLHRGDVEKEREIVAPGGVSAIRSVSSYFGLAPDAPEAERRLALARWLVDPKNPLTARVMVNRLWQFCFGTGLVASSSDFGVLGDRPTHPELLDWLAVEFRESGWSVKHLLRLIVTSATYRQSFSRDERAAKVDPENRWLGRYPARRLDAETIRDAMLTISGRLNLALGGPSFRPFRIRIFNSTFYDLIDEERHEWNRRSIYRMHIQSAKDPILECFDVAEPSVRTPKRVVTTTPLQALALMNSRFVLAQADAMTRRIQTASDPIGLAYQLVYSRPPHDEERRRAEKLVREAGMSSLCWVLLNSSEFVYLK